MVAFYLNNTINLRPIVSTHYGISYPQNGDRIVTMDPVTSLHLLYISRNLVNCCATVGTSFTNNPEQIEVAEFEHYGRRTCSKHPRSIDCRRRRQQSRPSASFVDNSIDLSWRKFPSPEFMTKIQSEVSIFCRYQNFTTPCRTGGRQLPCQNQLDAFSRFDRTSTCDRYRQTDGQTRGNASWFKAKVKQTGRRTRPISLQSH